MTYAHIRGELARRAGARPAAGTSAMCMRQAGAPGWQRSSGILGRMHAHMHMHMHMHMLMHTHMHMHMHMHSIPRCLPPHSPPSITPRRAVSTRSRTHMRGSSARRRPTRPPRGVSSSSSSSGSGRSSSGSTRPRRGVSLRIAGNSIMCPSLSPRVSQQYFSYPPLLYMRQASSTQRRANARRPRTSGGWCGSSTLTHGVAASAP